jgi:hypothetical protein
MAFVLEGPVEDVLLRGPVRGGAMPRVNARHSEATTLFYSVRDAIAHYEARGLGEGSIV